MSSKSDWSIRYLGLSRRREGLESQRLYWVRLRDRDEEEEGQEEEEYERAIGVTFRRLL